MLHVLLAYGSNKQPQLGALHLIKVSPSSSSYLALPFSRLFIYFFAYLWISPFSFAPYLALCSLFYMLLQVIKVPPKTSFSTNPNPIFSTNIAYTSPQTFTCLVHHCASSRTERWRVRMSEWVTDYWKNKKRVAERVRRVWDKCGQMGSVWVSRRQSYSG